MHNMVPISTTDGKINIFSVYSKLNSQKTVEKAWAAWKSSEYIKINEK